MNSKLGGRGKRPERPDIFCGTFSGIGEKVFLANKSSAFIGKTRLLLGPKDTNALSRYSNDEFCSKISESVSSSSQLVGVR